MVLNIPQVLAGCCVSSVCILKIREDKDFAKLGTANSSTLFFVKADDTETFDRLGKYVTARENLGEFIKVQVDWQAIKVKTAERFITRHKELMKDRKNDRDFRPGDIVAQDSTRSRYKVKEITQYGFEKYIKLGYMALDYCPYNNNNWVPYSYAANLSGYYRVE